MYLHKGDNNSIIYHELQQQLTILVDLIIILLNKMSEKPLWKQCADWLCQLEVLPSNHRIMWPDASIQVNVENMNYFRFNVKSPLFYIQIVRKYMIGNQKFTSIQDLAYTLRDGVVLCHIAAALDPASVNMKNVNQRPQVNNQHNLD